MTPDTTGRSTVEPAENRVFAGESGDGGNRTHESVQPSDVALIERNLGRLVLGLPAISASLGHTTVQESLVYLHAQGRPERELLYAMLGGAPTRELCERFYGSVDEALDAFAADAGWTVAP